MLRSAVVSRRFATRGVDFAKLASKVSSPAARSELASLRNIHEQMLHDIKVSSGAVAPIDWAYYKQKIKSNPAIVDEFEKEYNSLSLPSFENELKKEAEAKMNELVAEAKEMMEASKKREAELKALLAELESNRTDENSTIESYAKRNPDVSQAAKEEIENQEYFKDTTQ